MNDENPYRSPLAECCGTPANLEEVGGIITACGMLAMLAAAVWRTFWFTLGYVSEPVGFVYASVTVAVIGYIAMVVGGLRGR
jgi:hypothetical protein